MIQAAIFDLDGTVLDNEGLWQEAFDEVVKSHDLADFEHIPGIGILNNWKKMIPDLALAEQYSEETKQAYVKMTEDMEVKVRDGLVDLVGEIKNLGWQTGLATSSEWTVVERELEQLNLHLAFDTTTTGEEVLAAKPDPEIYLLTAQKMGVEPSECVVLEDSVAGVESAVEAGCLVIGITNEFADSVSLKAAGAKLVVDNFSEVMLLLRQHGDTKQENNSNSN
jgi:HAD superfamily hydrolase (TIGR01509 family)